MKQIKKFTLDSSNPTKKFNCQFSFSGLRIKRITIPFLSSRPISEWAGLLNGLSVSFKSTATDGSTKIFPILLLGQLSPDHQHPVFDFDFFVPEDNDNNMQSLTPFFNLLEIELLNQQKNDNLSVIVFYEENPIIS
jgi:hypothetical protein